MTILRLTDVPADVLALADADGAYPASVVERFSPQRFDFRWNDDFSRFAPMQLLWWDDASYIAYQCDCGDDGEEDFEPSEGAYTKRDFGPVCTDTSAILPDGEDLPF